MKIKDFLYPVKDYIKNYKNIPDIEFDLWRKPWEDKNDNTIVFLFDEKYIQFVERGIIISDSNDILNKTDADTKILIEKKDLFFILLRYYDEDFFHTLKPADDYLFIEKGERIKYNDTIIFGPAMIHKTAEIGNSIIRGPLYIGKNVCIGDFTTIGGNGFGVYDGQIVPHKGGVYIDDNVYIANQCNIDKATLGWTKIGKNTKIDSMVHIAHNVYIGENVIIAGQSGIAGSTIIKDNVLIGGQTGILEGLIIGNNVKIGGKTKVTKDIKDNMFIVGNPAREIKKWSL